MGGNSTPHRKKRNCACNSRMYKKQICAPFSGVDTCLLLPGGPERAHWIIGLTGDEFQVGLDPHRCSGTKAYCKTPLGRVEFSPTVLRSSHASLPYPFCCSFELAAVPLIGALRYGWNVEGWRLDWRLHSQVCLICPQIC